MGGLLLPAVLAGVAGGILAADAVPAAGTAAPTVLVASALLLGSAALARRPILLVAAAVLLGALVGAWRGEASELPVGPGSVGALIGASELVISATVSEEPRPRGERQQVVLDEVSVQAGDAERGAAGRILLWLPRALLVSAGDRVRFSAALEQPRDFDGFAYRAYLARQGIGATASAYEVAVVANRRGWLAGLLGGLRHTLEGGLNEVVPEPEAALADGILLGIRTGIAPEVGDAFQRAGLTHVVAISGWNIAIVAALAAAATRPLRRLPAGRWLALIAACLAVGGYVLLTGASPSVVRAALMAGGLVLARTQGSRAHAMSALALAALVMLLAAPPVLWDVGFQLSGLATAGLIWFGAGLESRLRRWPALLREPVALTVAAQLTTLPVILLNFERLSLVAPVANVVVVPLVPVVMLCGALAAVVGAVDAAFHVPIVGDLACWALGGSAWLYLRLMILAGQAAAAVPYASVDLGAPAWLAVAWYPGLWLLRGRLTHVTEAPQGESTGRLPGPRAATALTVVVLAVLTAASRPDGRLHLWMLDVGQGDAIVVRGPSGATALVDGGPDPELVLRRLGAVLPFWQ
ncbi:MAG TPA: ComEC/Rec2 family competence protein, partial [Candidatus Limnocylindria bacterium]